MFGFSKQVLANSIRSILARIVNKPWTPIVVYAPPGSGKTYFKRQVLFGGLPTFDTDEIWSYWWKKLSAKYEKELKSGALSEEQLYTTSYALVGWSMYSNMNIAQVGLIVTNLHDSVLVQLIRYGCVIVGYMPEYKVWYDRVYNRMRTDEERKRDMPKYIKWYKEVEAWKKTNYDKVNVWINDLEKLRHHLYTKQYCGFGRATTLREFKLGMDTRNLVMNVVLDSCIYYCVRHNQLPYFCDISTRQIEHICARGVPNYISRRSHVPPPKIQLVDVIFPLKYGKGDIDGRNTFLRCVTFANNNCRYIWAPYASYHLKTDGATHNFIITKERKGTLYTLFLYRNSRDYHTVKDSESFDLYEKVLADDIRLVKKATLDPKCRRIVYVMQLQKIVSKPIILGFRLTRWYIPYEDYGTTRICFIYDRYVGLRAVKKTHLSISILYEDVVRFNLNRKQSNIYDVVAYKSAIHAVTYKTGVCAPKLDNNTKTAILIGLPRMFKDVKKSANLLRRIEKWAVHKSIFMIPSRDAGDHIIDANSDYRDDRMLDFHKGKWVEYPAFRCDEIWRYRIQLYPCNDFIVMNRFYPLKGKWYVNEPFGICNPSDLFLSQHMIVGNVLSHDERKYQTTLNSQTHVMLMVSRLLRTSFGFTAKHIYKLRGSIVTKLNDSEEVVSAEVTFIKDDRAYAVSGHAINLLYASRFHTTDVNRWVDTIIPNIKMESSYKLHLAELIKLGRLTEPDGAYVRWHVPKEFEYIEVVANRMLQHSDLPKLDPKVVQRSFRRILEMKGYLGKNLEEFDISGGKQ